MAKSGVSKRTAKAAWSNVNKDLQNLEMHMNELVTHVEEMNKNHWYGSRTANTWYANMANHYGGPKGSLVKFYTGVSNFQSSLKRVFTKAKAQKIDF